MLFRQLKGDLACRLVQPTAKGMATDTRMQSPANWFLEEYSGSDACDSI